ncbi:MAG TPA: hypothetical protein DD490_28130, partial [Acidobacteria bacterium]|nr:hypothetical protein [Acidobacteriota bacterium]
MTTMNSRRATESTDLPENPCLARLGTISGPAALGATGATFLLALWAAAREWSGSGAWLWFLVAAVAL